MGHAKLACCGAFKCRYRLAQDELLGFQHMSNRV
jgi:hypothetical protein